MKSVWKGLLCATVLLITIELWTPVRLYKTAHDGFASQSYVVRSTLVDQQCGAEVQHLYLLKVHKAGSTTLQNLFLRFGLERDLNVMTMFGTYQMSYPHRVFNRMLPAVAPKGLTNGKYDIYCEHSIYKEEYLMTKLHSDTVNIAIIREPWSHFVSSFGYYSLTNKLQLHAYADPIAEFLENVEYYTTDYGHTRAKEVTHNRVAMEFGFQEEHHNVTKYLEYVNAKFVVLITERFSESLVVMKRRLCWGMKEILYAKARHRSYQKPRINETLVTLHKAWSPLDYVFYDYFKRVMDRTIAAQDNDFDGEVSLFEDYLSKTREFCDDVCASMGTLVKPRVDRESITSLLHSKTRFAESRWSSGFDITGLDCVMMRVDPSLFRNLQKIRLFPEFCTRNDSVIATLNIDPVYCDDLFHGIPWAVLKDPDFTSKCY